MEFTSREVATGIIAVTFILLSFALKKVRKGLLRSLLRAVKALAAWKVWTVVLAYLIFVVGVNRPRFSAATLRVRALGRGARSEASRTLSR